MRFSFWTLAIFIPWFSMSGHALNLSSGDVNLAPSSVRHLQPPAAQPTATLNAAQVYQLASPAVFKAITRLKGTQTENGHGTAFAIHPAGFLATNYHVVANFLDNSEKYELIIIGPEGSRKAEVRAVDAINDLAIVKVDGSLSQFLKIATAENLSIGDPLFSIGFPRVEEMSIIQGNFNGKNQMGFAQSYSASIPLNPGMSGGPALNSSGEVIGVNRALLREAQNISYLSPLPAIRTLISTDVTKQVSISQLQQTVVNQIVAQEKQILTNNFQLKQEKIGSVQFLIPGTLLKCGQDESKMAGSSEKIQALFCNTQSLSMINSGWDALQMEISAVAHSGTMFTVHGFHQLTSLYLKEKDLAKQQMTRKPANDDPNGARSAVEKCNITNVLNQHKVKMLVRYCAISIAEFDGLTSTFVKVDLMNKAKDVSFGVSYRGFSPAMTAKLLQFFLDSINVGGEK